MRHLLRHSLLALTSLAFATSAVSIGGRTGTVRLYKREPLQDLVTWDEHSIFVRGERVMLYSAEFHPFRLPVPDLWRDVLQKIKALGYNAVSFYVDWALLEGNPGHFSAEGIFGWEKFFEAAAEIGIYLIARPGPYVNAELSGGGFPGWLQRNPALLRTNHSAYLEATDHYTASIGSIIAKAQITNGGPVILFQLENEYTFGADFITFPDVLYWSKVEEQFRNAGIVVPLINNDAWYGAGRFVPGTPSAVDIYGVDSYPVGFNCANPNNWNYGSVPTDFHQYHERLSPSTPFMIVEFQAGAVDLWGGPGYDSCAALTGPEFERVYNKNDFAAGVAILSKYMTYGGTNWGNMGQPGGYTSYDYGSPIKEDRTITREKYSEAKLQAHFMAVSPAYLTARPGDLTNGTYVSSEQVAVTPLWGNKTNFYVVRPADYVNALSGSLSYKLIASTSAGNVSVPRLGGSLSLNGRDSKIHVTDYDLGGINLIYSSAEIFTWTRAKDGTTLILYGGADETHEFAVSSSLGGITVEGSGVKHQTSEYITTVNWQVTPARQVVRFGDSLEVHLLWRNDAYNHWALELPAASPIGNYSSRSKNVVIAKSGYLLRSASVTRDSISLTGDTNATTDLEIIAGHPTGSTNVYYNGKKLTNVRSANGRLAATVPFTKPTIDLPDLSKLAWKAIDSLPELQEDYDDSSWTLANLTETPNTSRKLTTPTSLYAGDYGYHTGSLIYRGHFTASASSSLNSTTSLSLSTQGGLAFGHSIWLGSTFLGSWPGSNAAQAYNQSIALPALEPGKEYIITILMDHMGTETNWTPGFDQLKTPRGILDYALSGYSQSAITWKLTGNLGGEQYRDQTRGPLNEGAMFAERQGYHQPSPPSKTWESQSPYRGINKPGVRFYTTTMTLDIPTVYDVPLAFIFTNTTSSTGAASNCTGSSFRVQLYVNGYQFGKYVNNVGPQTVFPVPPGIFNTANRAENTIALTLWALDSCGARLNGLKLQETAIVQSALGGIEASPQPAWEERHEAY